MAFKQVTDVLYPDISATVTHLIFPLVTVCTWAFTPPTPFSQDSARFRQHDSHINTEYLYLHRQKGMAK